MHDNSYEVAKSIVKKLVDAGYIAYFAGGWVRDLLMQTKSDDIDIATNAPISLIQSLFSKTIPVGIAFGILIVVEEGLSFEVATFRKDREYSDGRRPMGFDPATPQEDALRRDFTVNGMFYDPLTNQLIDYVKGQKDIQNKIIRAIGNPHERFLEDRLRMMRAIRYSTRFDFSIDPETQKAIRDHADRLFPAVAIERIWQEFKKMSRFTHFDKGLIALHDYHLLPTIFPELKTVSLEEIQQRVQFIERIPKTAPTIAELLELFPNSSLEKLLDLCEYLKLSKEERQFVTSYHHARSLLAMPKAWQDKLERIEWAHLYADPHTQLCLEIHALHLTDSATFLSEHTQRQELLQRFIERIKKRTPLITANDLIALGVPPGKKNGRALKGGRAPLHQRNHRRQRIHPKKSFLALKNKKLPLCVSAALR